ncbi:MAG TPA: hypothetical protein VJ761_12410 [Ktedonobacteraceae bacterium]|nr:hypothetical protein [Ktedonobacteraceae bacterium]
MTVQERPNYSIVATFWWKYQAVKAFHTVKELLTDDRKLRVYFIRDSLHRWYYRSSWFVAVFGPTFLFQAFCRAI